MKEHNTNFYSLENIKETLESCKDFLDGEEVYYQIGALRYAYDEIERLNYKIKSIVYMCYESDMSYDEFKQVWVNAFDKIYDPNDVEILEKELKGSDKNENN